jgi:hypothetical protein
MAADDSALAACVPPENKMMRHVGNHFRLLFEAITIA